MVSRYRDKALLIRAIPVWKETAFDVNCNAAICLAYRICSELRYRAVSFRSPPNEIIEAKGDAQ